MSFRGSNIIMNAFSGDKNGEQSNQINDTKTNQQPSTFKKAQNITPGSKILIS